jgi:hypothetical protein
MRAFIRREKKLKRARATLRILRDASGNRSMHMKTPSCAMLPGRWEACAMPGLRSTL